MALCSAVLASPEAGYSYPYPPNQNYHDHGSSIIQDRYGPPTYNQIPLVHKHIYVHVAPPDLEVAPPPQIISRGTSKKHYKIVFIKAPTPPTPTAPIIPPQVQNQEKTLIYVLVKRPEDAPQITIPTAKPTLPSKPEVYFIKYKTQKHTTAVHQKTETYGPPPVAPPRPVYGV